MGWRRSNGSAEGRPASEDGMKRERVSANGAGVVAALEVRISVEYLPLPRSALPCDRARAALRDSRAAWLCDRARADLRDSRSATRWMGRANAGSARDAART